MTGILRSKKRVESCTAVTQKVEVRSCPIALKLRDGKRILDHEPFHRGTRGRIGTSFLANKSSPAFDQKLFSKLQNGMADLTPAWLASRVQWNTVFLPEHTACFIRHLCSKKIGDHGDLQLSLVEYEHVRGRTGTSMCPLILQAIAEAPNPAAPLRRLPSVLSSWQ